MPRLRMSFEVTAGVIPGTPEPEYTRQWHVTDDEYQKPGVIRAAQAAAMAYAEELMNPQSLNWVQVVWIWY